MIPIVFLGSQGVAAAVCQIEDLKEKTEAFRPFIIVTIVFTVINLTQYQFVRGDRQVRKAGTAQLALVDGQAVAGVGDEIPVRFPLRGKGGLGGRQLIVLIVALPPVKNGARKGVRSRGEGGRANVIH